MTDVFFNELLYDPAGTDSGEAIEIAGPAGTDVTGWSVILYNGSNNLMYSTRTLSGLIPDAGNGFGTLSLSYPSNGIQNGAPDGMALVDDHGNVIQFLSYEGTFTAADGPASGMTSVDIGVSQSNADTNAYSLQLTGTGTTYEDFVWAPDSLSTFDSVNNGQTFGSTSTPLPGALSIGDASVAEGDAGTTDMVFTVSRDGGSSGAVSADWSLALGTADGSDLAAGAGTSGTVNFADGQTSATITIAIAGDTAFEPDETISVTLANPTGGATIGNAAATGTILNDDAGASTGTPNVWINEIHYDNSGTDTGEGFEIAGAAGTDLSGYSLVLYNGGSNATQAASAVPYGSTNNLTGIIGDEGHGFGALWFAYPTNGVQNGSPDGVALVAPDGSVVQFLSYEGVMTAASGPAAGMTSTDIGVSEDPAPAAGQSLQLQGAGATGSDFTWTAPGDASPGLLNSAQVFYGPSETGHLRVDDVSVVEGDSGTTDMVFTFHRAGGSDYAASVDYSIDTSGISPDDIAVGSPLSGTVSFGVGESVKTVVIPVVGDTVGEYNETLTLTLANPVGNVVIDDATAVGTIVNDDPLALTIMQIQGAGHYSEFVGQQVITTGIVTAVDTNGFYMQDAAGDGDMATSDAVFVFTGSAPTVTLGDGVSVNGTVSEYAPSGSGGLPLTEIAAPTVSIQSSGNALPTAVVIGHDGLIPPSEVTDDDGLTSFDPTHDGIDFWESLEGMRVTVETPQAVGNSNVYGETWVVASHGEDATGMNSRGGITNSEGDQNPERVILTTDSGIAGGSVPTLTIGDQLADVTGILTYGYNTYRVIATEAATLTHDETLSQEVTTLSSDSNFLSLATFNLENYDPGDMKDDALATEIAVNMKAPDIIAAQEIQDADGAGTGSDLSGTVTAQGLIDSLEAMYGLHYGYVEIAPTTANSTGGEPNGNIRSGYFYNLDRVNYVDGSAALVPGDTYTNQRNPLVAQWEFAGSTITTIDIHFYSRGGSTDQFGDTQAPIDNGDARRTEMAQGVKDYVTDLLSHDPSMNIAVLGDFNGFAWEEAQTILTDPAKGGVFTDLATLLPEQERASYYYDGNTQQIDHILVTGGLLSNAAYDAIHMNAEYDAGYADGTVRPTDHDPQLSLLMLGKAPTDLTLSNSALDENLPAGTVVGTLHAADTANDHLAYSLTEDANGLFAVDETTGIVTTKAPLDFETVSSYEIVGTATDDGGLSVSATFTVVVNDVKESKGSTTSTIYGTSADDSLFGGTGKDAIYGLDGNDALHGGFGADLLDGGNGNDALYSGRGNDIMTGGAGQDAFHFGWLGGHDTITDFNVMEDMLVFDDGVGITNVKVRDVDHDGINDLILTLGPGSSVTLLGVSDLSDVEGADFACGLLPKAYAFGISTDIGHML